jgi:hypothetical protein
MKHLLFVFAVGMSLVFGSLATVHASVQVGWFTGGDPGEGLDLQGQFLYALDFGNPNVSTNRTIGDATFVGPATATHNASWYTNCTPTFGSSANDVLLQAVVREQATLLGNLIIEVSAAKGFSDLVVGGRYKLQLLFHEAYYYPYSSGQRKSDIYVEGTKIVDDYDFGAWTTNSAAGVVTYDFVASDNVLNIMLENSTTYRVPIIDALTLEAIPEPATLTIWALLVGIAASISYQRRKQAA